MAEERTRSIAEMIDDDELMTEAIRQGVREELLSHARAGNSVPVSKKRPDRVVVAGRNLSTSRVHRSARHQGVLTAAANED